MKLNKLFALFAVLAFAFTVAAQTATPSTTLCAAVKATDKSVCLTAVTSVENQTGIYVDREYMLVTISASTALTAGGYVPVARGVRGAGNPPTAHANGAIAWLAYTPDVAKVPGVNGFYTGTNRADVGPCVRTSEIYLPHIWSVLGLKRDCSQTAGVWVPYNELADPVLGGAWTVLTGATTLPAAAGNYLVTGAYTVTLTAPTAGVQDGAILRIFETGSYQLVVSCSTHILTGNSATSVLTSTANYGGAGVVLMAWNGYWMVISNNGMSLTS